MKFRQSGFTMVELLVVVTIAVVLISLATPNFRALLVRRSVQSAVDTMVSDFRFARSEAIKRSARVSVCSSTNGTGCSGAASWKDGWLVFVDQDGSGTLDAADVILRVQDALPSISSIASTSPGSDRLNFVYQPAGWARASSQTFIFTPSGGGANRVVCVSNLGRVALRAEGAATCN